MGNEPEGTPANNGLPIRAASGGNTGGAFTDTPGPEGGNDYRGSFTILVETPEPSTYGMLGMGLMGLAILGRRRASA